MYAVVASNGDDGIQIIDITDPYNPIAASAVYDGRNGFEALQSPTSISIAGVEGRMYAVVASRGYGDAQAADGCMRCLTESAGRQGYPGMQIIDIADPYNPVAVSAAHGSRDIFYALQNPMSMDVAAIDGGVYAVVASRGYGGVQLIDIADPRSPTIASAALGDWSITERNPMSMGMAKLGGTEYAVVADYNEHGVRVIDIADSHSPTVASAVFDGQDGFEALQHPVSVDTFKTGCREYTAAAGGDGGTYILDITGAIPVVASAIYDGQNGFEALQHPVSMRVSEIEGRAYMVAASRTDHGIQIIDIADPYNPVAASAIHDGQNGFEALRSPESLDIGEIGGSVYALVASYGDDGVQIIDVTDPYNPVAASAIYGGRSGFGALQGPLSVKMAMVGEKAYAAVGNMYNEYAQIIDVSDPYNPVAASAEYIMASLIQLPKPDNIAKIGCRDYAVVASRGDHGIQIIDITDPYNPVAASAAYDGMDGFEALRYAVSADVAIMDGGVYAVVAGRDDHGVQIIDITDPYNPVAAAAAYDGMDGFEALGIPMSVSVTEAGGRMYAVVASYGEHGVQIIDITNPYEPAAASAAFNGREGFGYLSYPMSADTAEINGRVYAVVAGRNEVAVQIIDLTDPFSPVAASADHRGHRGLNWPESVNAAEIGGRVYAVVGGGWYGSGIQSIDITNPRIQEIMPAFHIQGWSEEPRLPESVGVAEVDGRVYAVVANHIDNDVEMIDITKPENPVIASAAFDGPSVFEAMLDYRPVDVAEIDGRVYAAVASYLEHSVKMVDISTPHMPSVASAVYDDQDGFEALHSPLSVDVMKAGERAYAVAVSRGDNGVQVIDVTDPYNPVAASAIYDGKNGFDALRYPVSAGLAGIDGVVYAVVASYGGSGVQVIDVTDPYNPVAASAIYDGKNGFDALRYPVSVNIAEIDGGVYAAVGSNGDNGVQIIDVTDPYNPVAASAIHDGKNGFDALQYPVSINIAEGEGRAYAAVTSRGDDGIQLIDMTDPYNPVAASSEFFFPWIGALWDPIQAGIVEIGSRVYAAVVSPPASIMEVIDITDPYDITSVSEVRPGGPSEALWSPAAASIAEIDGRVYAVIFGADERDIQMIDITDPYNPAVPRFNPE